MDMYCKSVKLRGSVTCSLDAQIRCGVLRFYTRYSLLALFHDSTRIKTLAVTS